MGGRQRRSICRTRAAPDVEMTSDTIAELAFLVFEAAIDGSGDAARTRVPQARNPVVGELYTAKTLAVFQRDIGSEDDAPDARDRACGEPRYSLFVSADVLERHFKASV